MTRMTDTLYEDPCTFMIMYGWIIPKTKKFSGKSCRDNQYTHFMSNNFFSENTAVYEILCKSIVKPDKPHMTIKYGASALHAR